MSSHFFLSDRILRKLIDMKIGNYRGGERPPIQRPGRLGGEFLLGGGGRDLGASTGAAVISCPSI